MPIYLTPSAILAQFPRAPATLEFDLDYRPPPYWDIPISSIIAIMRPDHARLRAEIAVGRSDPVLTYFLEGHPLMQHPLADPDENEQAFLEAMDPRYMSGAYLPTLEDHEVEIARIKMASTTGDVVSIRAKPCAEEIEYSITDEYQDLGETFYDFWPVISQDPLSLSELIQLIAGARLADIYGSTPVLAIGKNFDCERFLTFSSAYYQDFGAMMEILVYG